MKTKGFNFKQFSIEGGESGMPVSTDGVLLGAWIEASSDDRIIDIGTGTGLLALMCAQRFPLAHITAVDIEPTAIAAAKQNFTNSKWPERLTLHQTDVLTYKSTHLFEHIICNPPYFNNGEQAKQSQRATARHTDTLKHDQLLRRCYDLVGTNGKASFVLPITEGKRFIEQAKALGWNLSRLCQVKPSVKKPTHRLLFELSKQELKLEQTDLTINCSNGYSEAFTQLTREFYLKM